MYIYNKFCVHLRNVAGNFLSSPPPNDIFVIAAAVRLFPSITVSVPPTAEPSPVTTDLIAQRPPWEKAIRLKRACRCEESERIKIEQKGSGNLAQVVCDCSRSQLLELTNNNSTAVIVFFEPIQTYSNVLLYHASIFQIIKTRGLPSFWSDELSTDVSRRSRTCQRTQ